MAMLRPGVSFTELTQRGLKIPAEFTEQRYGVMMHGIGLCTNIRPSLTTKISPNVLSTKP
jgi:hypothetical protein